MTGLHNRYPSYFYKRGNLFNTYLNQSDGPSSPPAKAKRKPKPTMTPAAKARPIAPYARQATAAEAVTTDVNASSEPAAAGARLADFAQNHLTQAETARLVRLIADDLGVSIAHRTKTDWHLPFNLGAFVDQNVEPELAARYLKTLQGRLARGEPLIQK